VLDTGDVALDRLPPVGVPAAEAVPAGCPNGVEYELVQQLYSDDGAVRGAFSLRVPATRLGESTARSLCAGVDLRNFTGDLPVGWFESADESLPTVQIAWGVGAVPAPTFELTATLWGAPMHDACDWATCRNDADLGLPLSHGIVKAGTSLAGLNDLLRDIPVYTGTSTLSQLAARADVYTPNVRAWVTANAAPLSSESHINLMALSTEDYDAPALFSESIDLATDAERLPDGVASGFVDFGHDAALGCCRVIAAEL
jgi:hypothetical protein